VRIWAVRHGQSAANRAFAAAAETGTIDAGISGKDADVPLTDRGREQAVAVGRAFAAAVSRAPELVYTSPFRRARQTAELILRELAVAGARTSLGVDDRLVDRGTGILELLTPAAVKARFPQEAARHTEQGTVSYRPPGGESLWDVADRLRPFWAELNAEAHSESDSTRVIVAHDAVVMMLRAISERLNEQQILDMIDSGPVLNASITTWESVDGRLRLTGYNETGHL
jgi:probable phosphoglycerate mutase